MKLVTLDNTLTDLVLHRVPDIILDAVKAGRAFVAGGFIRDTISRVPPSDLDVFVPDGAAFTELVLKLVATGATVTRLTDRVVTLDRVAGSVVPVQVMNPDAWAAATATDVVGLFDFTMCKAVLCYAGGAWTVKAHPDFMEDVACRRLTYTPAGSPGGSLRRVLRFYARGWDIPASDLAGLVSVLFTRGEEVSKAWGISTEGAIAGMLAPATYEWLEDEPDTTE